MVNFVLPKVSRMTINFELLNDQFENLYISSHGEARNIKFGQQVNLIQRVQLGTPPQEVVMALAHYHVALTNLSISSYRGASF